MSEEWPDLKYAEEIIFEGCARLAIAPEEYEALLNSHAALQARLAECERAKDDHFMNSCLRANIESLATENDKIRAQLAETQKLLSVQLAVGDKLTAELAALREALEEVDKWDIRWADGLDSNVERIKSIVRDALEKQNEEPDNAGVESDGN